MLLHQRANLGYLCMMQIIIFHDTCIVDIILFVIHLYSCGFHKSFPESFVGLISVCLNGTDYFPDCSGSSSTVWSFLSKL